ncbi:DUF4124 domain-containing protein [Uliginosibacterium sp. sgz301328]|uniref:DUF4124 domain-containing protein n=1 Tax=Uliginosibacterium sp. sgz301328 TaxID=3243764 RepID=UPI00359DE02E
MMAVLAAPVAQADIYKCLDDAGHVTYTNDRPANGKGCTLLTREQPITTIPAPRRPAQTPTPASFPKVDDATQKSRDETRRQILDNELAAEQKQLEEARKELAEQESVRLGNERNFQKFLDRVQPFKDKVALHERNIEAIRKELSNLK